MTDNELAEFLKLDVELIARIKPGERAVYERMAEVEAELALWLAGAGPRPAGVLIDTTRSVKRRRAWA